MALVHAEPLDGRELPPLSGPGPHSCGDLLDWCGRRFTLPPGDAELSAIHEGALSSTPAHDNLVGAGRAWAAHPSWMDQLSPDSPVHRDKQMERDLYLEDWARHLSPGGRALDVGGGVGRFAQVLLAEDWAVELVDPDLRSLWCALDRLGGGPGRLDLHWTTGGSLGDLAPVDLALAVEVLCYVPDPAAVLQEIRRVLRPGGVLLLSVEARQGAAQVRDSGPMDAAGVVHVPGDRWVQTYTEETLRGLLVEWEILELAPSHYVLSGPLEAQWDGEDLEALRALERAARMDEETGGLNRAWTAVVR